MIVFDIDGVLTPKNWGVNINLKLTNDEVKAKIANAIPARDGFAILNSFFHGFVYLFETIQKQDDTRAWNRILFLTGRKESEFKDATLNLFRKWQQNQAMEGIWADHAITRVIWYPENLGYKPEVYHKWKMDQLMDLWFKYGPIIYIDDDKALVDKINANLGVVARGIKAYHFEAKESI